MSVMGRASKWNPRQNVLLSKFAFEAKCEIDFQYRQVTSYAHHPPS
jgi:hypothetical protein